MRKSVGSRHPVYRIARWGFMLVLAIILWVFSPFDIGGQSADEAMAQNAQDSAAQVPETVMNGWRWFHVYCFRCHGTDALGSQLAPNLRESIKNLKHQEFVTVVSNGRPDTAMQPWNGLLDEAQIEDVYQYVLARSKGRLGRGRPDEQ